MPFKMYVLMVARYFTPQHGLKGWSERGGTSGVVHITKGMGQGPCTIELKLNVQKHLYFSKIDPKNGSHLQLIPACW